MFAIDCFKELERGPVRVYYAKYLLNSNSFNDIKQATSILYNKFITYNHVIDPTCLSIEFDNNIKINEKDFRLNKTNINMNLSYEIISKHYLSYHKINDNYNIDCLYNSNYNKIQSYKKRLINIENIKNNPDNIQKMISKFGYDWEKVMLDGFR